MTTCLQSPPRCLTFGRTPLTPRLQFFLLHPSTCLLWSLSLRPTNAGSSSPLHRNPASSTLFLHPYCRSLSMFFSRSSPSSAITTSVKELCLRPRSNPSWFLSSSARDWMRAIQTTTGQLRLCRSYQRSLKRLLPSSLQRILRCITFFQRFNPVSERAIPLRPTFSPYSLTSSELSITAS